MDFMSVSSGASRRLNHRACANSPAFSQETHSGFLRGDGASPLSEWPGPQTLSKTPSEATHSRPLPSAPSAPCAPSGSSARISDSIPTSIDFTKESSLRDSDTKIRPCGASHTSFGTHVRGSASTHVAPSVTSSASWSRAPLLVALLVALAGVPHSKVNATFGNWWYLGLQISNLYEIDAPAAALCRDLKYLNPVQMKMCSSSRNVFLSIGRGARVAIQECQNQFRNRRWNCTTFNHTSVFGRIVALKSRESAYIYAINSAGVMYAITRSCSAGEIPDCGCDNSIRHTDTKGEFEWGGCSDDITYGVRFAQEFVDSKERLDQLSANSLMNLHNNFAGRSSLESSLKLMCKCHGVSGSCSVKICWRTMAGFSDTGFKLQSRYDGATRVKFSQRKRELRPKYRFHKKPTKDDLVYLNKSPSFCEKNHRLGILGTKGRLCSKDPLAQDSCDLLCCGRGYYTLLQEVKEDCECKFIWCCNVECKTCVKQIERRFCN